MSLDTAANLLVASRTAVLATYTAMLARQTKRTVDAASEQADIARQQVAASERQANLVADAQAASVQPNLVAVPLSAPEQSGGKPFAQHPWVVSVGHNDDVGSRSIDVPLRNIGPGVAVIRGIGVTGSPGISWGGSMTSSIVAVDEVVRFKFEVPGDRPELKPLITSNGFDLVVSYTDISGNMWYRTCANVHYNGSRWLVRQVFLYRGDEPEPFASSGPADG